MENNEIQKNRRNPNNNRKVHYPSIFLIFVSFLFCSSTLTEPMSFFLFNFSLPCFASDKQEKSLPHSPLRIVVLGDSIAAGDGVAKEKAYPSLLESLLHQRGHDVKVINAGVSGSTTASALNRLKWQLNKKINILILELGGNDGLRGVSIASTKKNLSDTILLAQKEKIKILLTGMKLPVNYGNNYREQFFSMFAELSRKHSITLMPFLLEDIGGKEDFNIGDGIHPNEKGHKKIAENLVSYIEKLL